MDTPEQFNDPELLPFDQWLNRSRVQPPANLLTRVRAHLQEPSASLDKSIDQYLDSVEFLNKHPGKEQVYFYISNLD